MRESKTAMEGPFDPTIPNLLPHENMYMIQVGTRLFKISGASLSSDGPSFFTEKFSNSKNSGAGGSDNVLFIDRSGDIFELIYSHLQGYFIDIKDEVQFTRLFADAMYYNLPRLRSLLMEYDYYFANISGKTFKIAKNLFRRKGDFPNFFSITSAALYADVEELFITKKLLRPPPQSATYVSRPADLFEDLLLLLDGASIELDDMRRESLIKECRYYRFLNLEQRLIKSKIFFNPLTQNESICLSLKDLDRKGVEFPLSKTFSSLSQECCSDSASTTESSPVMDDEPALKRLKTNCARPSSDKANKQWNLCAYSRPHLDTIARDLFFQIDSNHCTLIFNKRRKIIHLQILNDTAVQFKNVFHKALLDNNVDLSNYRFGRSEQENSPNLVIPACVSICDLQVNGVKYPHVSRLVAESKCDEKVADFTDMEQLSYCSGLQLHLTKSLWKLGVSNNELILIALKAEAFAGTKEYCKILDFL